jgi:hypothetical protein
VQEGEKKKTTRRRRSKRKRRNTTTKEKKKPKETDPNPSFVSFAVLFRGGHPCLGCQAPTTA